MEASRFEKNNICACVSEFFLICCLLSVLCVICEQTVNRCIPRTKHFFTLMGYFEELKLPPVPCVTMTTIQTCASHLMPNKS